MTGRGWKKHRGGGRRPHKNFKAGGGVGDLRSKINQLRETVDNNESEDEEAVPKLKSVVSTAQVTFNNDFSAFEEAGSDITLSSLDFEEDKKSVSSRTTSVRTATPPPPIRAKSPKKAKKRRSSEKKSEKKFKKSSSEKKVKKKKKSKEKADKVKANETIKATEADKVKAKETIRATEADDVSSISSESLVSIASEKKPSTSPPTRSTTSPSRKRPRRSPPARRASSPAFDRGHRSTRGRGSFPPRRVQSWEDKVEEFVRKLNVESVPEVAAPVILPEEPSCENIILTPLMKFVAAKLTAKKTPLALRGIFQYSLLSLLTRSEWVAAKSIQLLEAAGFDNDWLYDTAAIKGGSGLKEELKQAVSPSEDDKLNLGKDKAIVNLVLKVADIVVLYFTSEEQQEVEDDQVVEEAEQDEEVEEQPQKRGLAGVLERLQTSNPPPPPPMAERPDSQINHWSMLADNIQANNLNSFEKLEGYLSQDLLRVTSQNKEDGIALLLVNRRPTKDVFDVARNMVLCWVVAGYSFSQLWTLVSQTNGEDILPPRDPSDTSRFFIGPRRPGDKIVLAHKFTSQFKTMGVGLTDRQLDYVVWKSLVYVMRGCGKMITTASASNMASNYNVSFNYLPPGLREMEAAKTTSTSNDNDHYVSSTTSTSATMLELSEDPMNIIIDPHGLRTKTSSEVMPMRKYLLGALHLEWVMFKGRPEIYEISLHMSDLSSLELFIVPDSLKKESNLMEALGFTLNRNLNKYFYVQSGMGCVTALTTAKAMEKLVEFLEAKRNATDENQNNGLVLVASNGDHLASFLTGPLAKHPDLVLNTIKGFGLLTSIGDLGEPQFSLGGNDSCFTASIVTKDNKAEDVMSKSKAELVLKALEAGLGGCHPGYDIFVRPFCFPSDGQRIKSLKVKWKKIEAMYDLEVFISAELRSNQVEAVLEGIYAPASKELRHKCDVVAFKICETLVDLGLDFEALKEKFGGNPVFTVNPDLILNRMDISHRLKVLNQTRACLDFVRHYFKMTHNRSSGKQQQH